MRGAGPIPVMSPMSKSFRKRERSASRSARGSASTIGDSPAKKQRLGESDSHGTSPKGENVEYDTAKKSAVHSSSNLRASLDSSSNKTFTVRAPKIFKVTAAENDHGSHSPVDNTQKSASGASNISPSNTSQTRENGPSVSSPLVSTPEQLGQRSLLRPRQSAARRKRRPYQDVLLTEDDATRILGHRIKVWWPLDKKWYTGEVSEYDCEQRRHWIIYDDQDEEWLKLEEECFKLQFLPGDEFERPTSSTAGSSYRVHASGKSNVVEDHSSAVAVDVCSDQDENPSRAVSEDNSLLEATATKPFLQSEFSKNLNEAPFGRALSVYVRRKNTRKRSKGSGSPTVLSSAARHESTRQSDSFEVQSPARAIEPSETLLSGGETTATVGPVDGCFEAELGNSVPVEQVADDAVQVDETGVPPGTSEVMLDADVERGQDDTNSLVESCSTVPRQGGIGSVLCIERWPLSRNVAELLRYIEIRSHGRRGALIGGRVMNPVWDIGNLFGLKLGASTETISSGGMRPHVLNCAKIRMGSNGTSFCMLISWNGYAFEKNMQLREQLSSVGRLQSNHKQQVRWQNLWGPDGESLKIQNLRNFAAHIEPGSCLSVTLSCLPPRGNFLLDSVAEALQIDSSSVISDRQLFASFTDSVPCTVPASKLVFTALVDGDHCGSMLSGEVQDTCFNIKPYCAHTRQTPSGHSPKDDLMIKSRDEQAPCRQTAHSLLVSNSLQQLFESRWEELNGSGLHLSFKESSALFSSRYVLMILRMHRLNTEAVLLLSNASLHMNDRLGVHELLSMSKKGRRSGKGFKRASVDVVDDTTEGSQLQPAKRIRIQVPEVAEQDPSQLHPAKRISIQVPEQDPSQLHPATRISIQVPEVAEQDSPSPVKIEEPLCNLTPVEVRGFHSGASRGNILKLRRCPTKKGMWCLADKVTSSDVNSQDRFTPSVVEAERTPISREPLSGAGKRRLPEYSIEDEDIIGDYDQDMFDEFDNAEMAELESLKVQDYWLDCGASFRSRSFDRKKRRRGAFGGFEGAKSSCRGRPSTEQELPDVDPIPCSGNLLIVQSDRGWREVGATVELQADGRSWALTVSLNGEVLYSYKVQQHIHPGVSNKYTHAMMWRGGKDWILEFPDKQQWSQFRFMHDVCCNRNARAQCVKHIPIPGVREVSDSSGQSPIVSFFRPLGDYIRYSSGEVEMALTTSKVLYDMDSEDEEWLSQAHARKADETGGITDDVLEAVMDQLERATYLQNQEISLSTALELCVAIALPETIKLIHAHWLKRRQKKGLALIRCFQPAHWEQYQALVQAWEAETQRHPVTRQHTPQQSQKPAMFAFCLRPKGLEVPNKMQRQRSQRRLASVSRQWNTSSPMSFDSTYFDYSDQQYLDEAPGLQSSTGHRYAVAMDLSSSFAEVNPTAGSPGFDEDYGMYPQRVTSRQRSRGRKPGRKPKRMRSISANEELGRRTSRSGRTFIAPSTAMQLDPSSDGFDQFDGDSCSSIDLDLNDEAVAKAAWARKAARNAAAKAARAQELYAIADAAMNKAVACLIEAEAIAAAEKAAREVSKNQKVEDEVVNQYGDGDGSEDNGHVGNDNSNNDDDDLLLPISSWTQEFGSGLIQKAEVSPRKNSRYSSLSSSQAPLFRGMVS